MLAHRRTASLRTYLIVPFIFILVVVMGLVGWLSFRNSQHAVHNLGQQLRQELAARIHQHLDDYLLRAEMVTNVTMDAVQRGELRTRDANSERYLWKLLQIFPTPSWIYYGEEATGNFVGISRHEPDKALWLVIADPTTGGEIVYYDTDAQGRRVGEVNREPGLYDPRPRPWYTAAVKARRGYWSEIYPDWGTGRLVLSLGAPAYGADDRLLGVCTVDIFLDDISTFLHGLHASQNGKIFIVERSGALVATSAPEPPFWRPDGASEARRLPMTASHDALIAATGGYLMSHIDLGQLAGEQQFDFSLGGRRQLGQIVPYQDGRGLDWLIVIVTPEADLMGQVVAGTQQTLALMVFLGLLAVLGAWLMVRRITQPLVELTRAAGAIAQGDLAQRVAIHGPEEVGVLAGTFNHMAADLASAFETLEDRVRERTNQLREVNQNLRQEKARLERYNSQRELLTDMTDLLQANLAANEANGVVSAYLSMLFPQCKGALYLLSASGRQELAALWGGHMTLEQDVALDNCWAFRHGRPCRFARGASAPPCGHIGPDIHHTLCLPLLAQGEYLGSLCIATQDAQETQLISEEDERLFTMIARSVAMALANLHLREQLRHQSVLDGLTGLFNRRYLDEVLPRELERAEREGTYLSVLMFDIDHFKRFNDAYGHEAGDVVLRAIAALMQGGFRQSDIACRYGGEEFVVVLPDTPLDVAAGRAETLREAAAELSVVHHGAHLGRVTISVGVAAYPDHGQTRDELLKAADAAAYAAKRGGRNQVLVASDQEALPELPA